MCEIYVRPEGEDDPYDRVTLLIRRKVVTLLLRKRFWGSNPRLTSGGSTLVLLEQYGAHCVLDLIEVDYVW